MKREVVSHRSSQLNKYMDLIVYGEKGYPVVVFPTQDAPCTNFEDFGMVDTLADYIESGKIQLFCASSIDAETWSDAAGDKEMRSEREEAYYRYVVDELVPYIHEKNGSDLRPLAIGCSMGATHAAIFALRRPDLFQGCIGLSGVYSSQLFYGNWMDDTLYANDPCAFLPNMPEDHPYVALYNQRQLCFCVGQGAWEEDGVRTQRVLDEEFERLGVGAWCDYWGFDVNHDWPWWKKQIRYFLPIVLDDIQKSLAAEKPAEPAKKAPARKKAPATEGKEPTKVVKKEEPEAETAPAESEAKPAAAKAAAQAEAKPAAKAAAPAKAATTTAVAKTQKPAVPAKAVKPAVPAKTQKPAVPAKAVKPAVPAAPAKPAAKAEAKPAAAAKPAAKSTAAAKPAAKSSKAKTSVRAAKKSGK